METPPVHLPCSFPHKSFGQPVSQRTAIRGFQEGSKEHTNLKPPHCGPFTRSSKVRPPSHTNNSLSNVVLYRRYSICAWTCCTAAAWIGLCQVSDSAAPPKHGRPFFPKLRRVPPCQILGPVFGTMKLHTCNGTIGPCDHAIWNDDSF